MRTDKHDCVFCANERGKGPDGESCPWCLVFNEPISDNAGYVPQSHKYSHSGKARRSQEQCSGFSLDPGMANRWREVFG